MFSLTASEISNLDPDKVAAWAKTIEADLKGQIPDPKKSAYRVTAISLLPAVRAEQSWNMALVGSAKKFKYRPHEKDLHWHEWHLQVYVAAFGIPHHIR